VKTQAPHFLFRWTKNLLLTVVGLWAFFSALLIATTIALWIWIASQLPELETLLKRPVAKCKSSQPAATASLPQWRIDAYAAVESPGGLNPSGTPTLRLMLYLIAAPVMLIFDDKGRQKNSASQLLAHNLMTYPDINERTLVSQFKRLVLSDIVETTMSEEAVVNELLARSYFGQGATGLECAARSRYNRNIENLSLAQFAMLVGLLKGPNNYDPDRHQEAALERRKTVLDIWRDQGIVTPEDVVRAKAEPLR
jgi:Transglycosylase